MPFWKTLVSALNDSSMNGKTVTFQCNLLLWSFGTRYIICTHMRIVSKVRGFGAMQECCGSTVMLGRG